MELEVVVPNDIPVTCAVGAEQEGTAVPNTNWSKFANKPKLPPATILISSTSLKSALKVKVPDAPCELFDCVATCELFLYPVTVIDVIKSAPE